MSSTTEQFFERIDGPLLAQQRAIFIEIMQSGIDLNIFTDQEIEALEGLMNLLDNLADIAHDEYGKDCLLIQDNEGEYY